jgi:hypothetical protein
MKNDTRTWTIGVVGPCGSGKTTLVDGLKDQGWNVRHIAQEHSYVKDMWLRITHPDFLVFLNASYIVTTRRRNLNWTEDEYNEQQRRLQHARRHANLLIETDCLSPLEIRKLVMESIRNFFDQSPNITA